MLEPLIFESSQVWDGSAFVCRDGFVGSPSRRCTARGAPPDCSAEAPGTEQSFRDGAQGFSYGLVSVIVSFNRKDMSAYIYMYIHIYIQTSK